MDKEMDSHMETGQPADTPAEQPALRVTGRAVDKARDIFERHPDAGGFLRVYVEGGGCSGFQYGFDLDSEVEPDDIVLEVDGIRVVVDPMSYQYLEGAELDYAESLQGSQFVVRNPNAKTTCGCGLSFSI